MPKNTKFPQRWFNLVQIWKNDVIMDKKKHIKSILKFIVYFLSYDFFKKSPLQERTENLELKLAK